MNKTLQKDPSLLKAKSYKLKASFSSGFTLLFAVLIASLLFALGLSIAHLSMREILLSVAGKESAYAFFSADTGIECALYWDFNIGHNEAVFPVSYDDERRATIDCAGARNVPVSILSASANAATSTFTLDLTPHGCAIVLVGKTASGATVLEARGRNDCGVGQNPGRLERALRVKY